MCWKRVIFSNEKEVHLNKEIIWEIIQLSENVFIDREYNARSWIRIRGLEIEKEEIVRILGLNMKYTIEDEKEVAFQNSEQFLLNCHIHHQMDVHWFPYYFCDDNSIQILISNAKRMAEELTITEDEGYNSHMSHFWGFFQSLKEEQKIEIAKLFQGWFEKSCQITSYKSMINIPQFLCIIEKMIVENKIDFYSPQGLKSVLERKKFSSKMHEIAARSACNSEFLYSKHMILNRWYLNALYVSMILMKIPVIYRFYMNYVVAMEKYPVNEICENYINTGVEKIWLR